MYSKVSSEMTSMTGQTTAFLFLAISARRGSSQPSEHSHRLGELRDVILQLRPEMTVL